VLIVEGLGSKIFAPEMTFENQEVRVFVSFGAPPTFAWIDTVEFTDTSTWSGPTASVQSGGSRPVAGIPAKLFRTDGGAAAGAPASGAPGASTSEGAAGARDAAASSPLSRTTIDPRLATLPVLDRFACSFRRTNVA